MDKKDIIYAEAECKICHSKLLVSDGNIESEVYFQDAMGTTVTEAEAVKKAVYRITKCPICQNKAVLYVINYTRKDNSWLKQ